MLKFKQSSKLKLAGIMYILVVAIMTGYIFADTNRINFGSTHSENPAQAVAINTQADTAFNKYYNDKYGFSVEYPANFKILTKESNSDCGIFMSPDKNIKLTIYGSNNIPYEPSETLMKKDASIIDGSIKTQNLNSSGYEISWIRDNTFYYRRVSVGTEALNSLMLSYPINISPTDNSILKHIMLSFKNGNLEIAH